MWTQTCSRKFCSSLLQLSLLRQKLESFAHSRIELSRIQANPKAASKFYAICNRLGIYQIAIQPSEAVEVQELGIRVCEVLFAARQFSGGLISWKDLRLKTRCAATNGDDEKLRRASASLAPLGLACEIASIGNEKQANNLNGVVSISNAIQTTCANDKMGFSNDSQIASNYHQYSNCWIKCGQLTNDSSYRFEALQVLKELQLSNGQSIHSLQTKLAWKPASKLQRVLVRLEIVYLLFNVANHIFFLFLL
jgi:hypothetical protein